jgi:hypothetical protein
MLGSDGYIHMARRMVRYVKYYFKNMFYILLLIAIYRKLKLFLSQLLLMCTSRVIGDQTKGSLRSFATSRRLNDW